MQIVEEELSNRPPGARPSPVVEELRRGWNRFIRLAISITFDAVTILVIIGAFSLITWVLNLSRAAGLMSEEHWQAFERAHFWINYALLCTLGISSLLKAGKMLFFGRE